MKDISNKASDRGTQTAAWRQLRWRKQRDALLIAREAIKDAHASELPNTMVGETLRLLNSQIYWTEQQIARFEEAG